MKTKRLYQSPWTRRDVVELEDGFCGSVVVVNESPAKLEEHEVNTDFGTGFETNAWDE